MCMAIEVTEALMGVGKALAAVANSNFSAALAGAFAGAIAAQRIGDRNKQRDALLHEIRSINAAVTLSFSVCNSGLSLKKQYVKDIRDKYVAQKAEVQEFHRRRRAGEQQPDEVFEFRADLRTLQMPTVPIDLLQQLVLEKISVTGRPLALIATLSGSINSLRQVLEKRSSLVEGFKTIPQKDQNRVMPALYFGLPFGDGHVSEEFPDTVEALYRVTDDVIFFSDLLLKDLVKHGERVLTAYKKIAKLKSEKISKIDLSAARAQGLMPDHDQYEDWLNGFRDDAQQIIAADV